MQWFFWSLWNAILDGISDKLWLKSISRKIWVAEKNLNFPLCVWLTLVIQARPLKALWFMNLQIENLSVSWICDIILKATKNASDVSLWTQILAFSRLKVLKIGLFIQRLKCDMCWHKAFWQFSPWLTILFFFQQTLYTEYLQQTVSEHDLWACIL